MRNDNFLRYPRNRTQAEEWNSSLGFEANKIIRGFVCVEHFGDECFERNTTNLRANAVPTKPAVEEVGPNEIDCTEQTVSPSSTIAMVNNQYSVDIDNVDNVDNDVVGEIVSPPPSTCEECKEKDAMVEKKEAEIENLKYSLEKMRQKHEAEITELKARLRKTQKQVWYLETVKRKLEAAFDELKKQSLVDEELCRGLEVLKNDDLFRVLHHGVKGGQKYPEKVRHFCLGLIT